MRICYDIINTCKWYLQHRIQSFLFEVDKFACREEISLDPFDNVLLQLDV